MDLEEVHVQIIKNGICNHLHRPVHGYHAYKDILKVEINSELAEPDNCEDWYAVAILWLVQSRAGASWFAEVRPKIGLDYTLLMCYGLGYTLYNYVASLGTQ